MPPRHVAAAVLTAVIWGTNFVAIRESLDVFPPLLLVALRFAVIAVPIVLFVPRPDVEPRWLVGYGLGFGTLHYAGLYLGMDGGVPAGLASLVLQSSAPFSVVLGALLLREVITPVRATGVAIAVGGLALVGVSRASAGDWAPYLLVILGGLGWALGNLAGRKAQAPNGLHLMLWMTVVPPLPLLALSLLTEGPDEIADALSASLTADAAPAWLGLGYTVVLGTVVGAAIWTWLMGTHPVSTVAPFSMLVPVTGLLAGWLVLHERPTGLELAGGALVVAGVLVASRSQAPAPAAAPKPALVD